MSNAYFDTLADRRIFALVYKEFRQTLRNRQLLYLLLCLPILQICLYGFALSPEVQNLRLGVADLSLSPISRELISALVENHVFDVQNVGYNQRVVAKAVQEGKLDAGLIIPPEFNRRIKAGLTAPIQVFLDGVDANSAGIANGYIAQIINQFSLGLMQPKIQLPVQPQITYIYNPGLVSSWFFVPGVMGLVLSLTGTLVSSAALVREKDSGTLEQLIMTPADSWEILIAKIVPLFFLLYFTVFLTVGISTFIFRVPFRGNFFLYLLISGIYIFVAISIGIVLATISANQRQAILTSFFFNFPLIQLSGSLAPIESMPKFFQYLSLLNPLRYYIECIRSILLRGVGIEVMWPNVLFLFVFATVLLLVSARQFRRQLG